MLLVNGFPKSGTHALLKACELLGVPGVLKHISFKDKLSTSEFTKHIFIKRDPRNIIISMLRFQGRQVTPGMFLAKFRYFEEARLVTEMASYTGWLTDSEVLVIKFENLISNAAEIKKIASYLAIDYIDGAYEELPGYTRTWNERHSNYSDIWTPQIENAWNNEGGKELLIRWGY